MAMLEDELGDIVGKARIGLGLTRAQLAASTGLSERDIAAIEACRLKPEPEGVRALAIALSLDPDKLARIAEGWTPADAGQRSDRMLLETVPVAVDGYQENCYVVGCAETHLGAVIDPGGAVSDIVEKLAVAGLALDLVLVTHAHGDHVGGLRPLLAGRPSVRIANHQLERDSVVRGIPNPWLQAKDSVAINLGRLTVTPLFTPGHTPGSMCYLIDGACFVGDTLFSGSIGRPSGPQAYRQMLKEIETKLLSLPDSTLLLPGHGPVTTVGEEREHNPFF